MKMRSSTVNNASLWTGPAEELSQEILREFTILSKVRLRQRKQ